MWTYTNVKKITEMKEIYMKKILEIGLKARVVRGKYSLIKK